MTPIPWFLLIPVLVLGVLIGEILAARRWSALFKMAFDERMEDIQKRLRGGE